MPRVNPLSSPSTNEDRNTAACGEPRTHSAADTPAWLRVRPLSDIRELTEPSLADNFARKPMHENHSSRSMSLSRKYSAASTRRPSLDERLSENIEPKRRPTGAKTFEAIGSGTRGRASRTPSPPSPGDDTYSSIYSIPRGSIPPRSSSRARARSASRPKQSITAAPSLPLTQRVPALPLVTIPPAPPRGSGNTIPRRGHSLSPLRQVAVRLNPVSNDVNRRVPSRTFIREPLSTDILEFPNHRHPRVNLGLELTAGIFVGGGTIEGTVQVHVNDAERIRHRRSLNIARISVDLLGTEEMAGARKSVFLNLATELIDSDNPPPSNMVESQDHIAPDDPFWHLIPSFTHLPFIMSLPLDVGPPPFQSKNARIRYLLSVSLLIRDHGKQYVVRISEDISVLSVYDPEKALMSLPSPLTASDEHVRPRDNSLEVVRVTAGLHRQVWVSGTCIYVDVHIVNNSRKPIKKIELQLERDILCYKHAAASTMEKSASQARIFDSNERSILSKTSIKQGTAGWNGVAAHTTHMRTCDLELPRGHATVKCGKYFEVRYFLNVIIGTTHTKLVTVQLPIVLIHMNSLDVVPNSVEQVAAAIEERRTQHTFPRARSPSRLSRRPSQSVQGRAFAAPRMQSLDRMRAQAEDLQELGQILENSPRKFQALRRVNSTWDYHTPPSNRKGRVLQPDDLGDLQKKLRHIKSNDTIASKHTTRLGRGTSMKSRKSRAGSALGFREAEVRDDIELGGLALGGESSFKARLEAAREKQFQFRKMRSMERWKGINIGVGWMKGADRDRDKGDNWI